MCQVLFLVFVIQGAARGGARAHFMRSRRSLSVIKMRFENEFQKMPRQKIVPTIGGPMKWMDAASNEELVRVINFLYLEYHSSY